VVEAVVMVSGLLLVLRSCGCSFLFQGKFVLKAWKWLFSVWFVRRQLELVLSFDWATYPAVELLGSPPHPSL
jgi:hypothetical protein